MEQEQRTKLINDVDKGCYIDLTKAIKSKISKTLGPDWNHIVSDLRQETLLTLWNMDSNILLNNIKAKTIPQLLNRIIKWKLSKGKGGLDSMSSFYKEMVWRGKQTCELNESIKVEEEEQTPIYMPYLGSLIEEITTSSLDKELLNLYWGFTTGKKESLTTISKTYNIKYYFVRKRLLFLNEAIKKIYIIYERNNNRG